MFMLFLRHPVILLHLYLYILRLLDKFLRTYPHTYLLFLLRTNTLSRILHVCGLRFVCYFVYYFFLSSLIYSQSAMNGVFNIMSRPKISWPGVAYSVLWYMLSTTKAVYANIPDQGSYSSR